jgi:hypothetical protein
MKSLPDNRLEEVPNDPDEVGGMNQKEGLQVLLVTPVQSLVRVPKPAQWRLVLRCKAVVEINLKLLG